MGNSLKLGSIAGIKLQVHWSFSLILVWVLATSLFAGKGLAASFTSVAFILALFCCVVLHELGHAFAARLYGIPTRDITLLPIGGVARLERMPRKPSQELVVALAGPAVNVGIAGVLFLLLAPATSVASLFSLPTQSGSFLQQLMIVNIALVLFNLLPAFPMDGGRVLRALLATVMDYVTATKTAAVVGQVCAAGLGLLSFYNPMLLLIAVFIFFGAATEANQVATREQFRGYRVRDGMVRKFRAVSAQAPLRELVVELLELPQREFPVIDNGHFVGMLNIDDALLALEKRDVGTAGEAATTDVTRVNEDDSLSSTFEQLSGRPRTLPVTRNGELTGLLDVRRVADLLKARSRLNARIYNATPTQSRPVPEFS